MSLLFFLFSGATIIGGAWLISSATQYRREACECEKCGYVLSELPRSIELCPECGASRIDFGRVQFRKRIAFRPRFIAGIVIIGIGSFGILAAMFASAIYD
jgi:hypothetical protein